ncbi:TetR/AcrR family transcriptional regulator [Mycobacterium sp. SM3041]|uniref:TetR/AcrR family transcriptional regulator n=1 Tax=Mycobacterium sp. SM3041 TaxID=3114291 RepID=UPI003204D8AD
MDTEPDGRVVRSEKTRSALVAAARELFVRNGYAAVSTTDIARAAQVTRNALYYHFTSKEAVFRAVYEDVEGELAQRVIPAAQAEPNPGKALEIGCEKFLDGCLEPAVARVSILDAPAALGFEQMREIDNRNYLQALRAVISAAIAAGELVALPVDVLASMLVGALDEAALLIASADDPRAVRREAGQVAQALLRGLRPAPGGGSRRG